MRRTAALLYHPDGYTSPGAEILGRRVAGEEFLRGLVRHGDLAELRALVQTAAQAEAFRRHLALLDPRLAASAHGFESPAQFEAAGTIFLPGPALGPHAWWRRRYRQDAFSLCGVTHTTATARVMDAVGDMLVAPVQPWDALVCTSVATRGMVRRLLEEHAAYLADRFAAPPPEGPELAVIPLGVAADAFAPDPAARAHWREALGIGAEEVAGLVVGRLDPPTKFTPGPMYLALEQAARTAGSRLHLILAGYFESDHAKRVFLEGAAALCPSVEVHHLDGRRLEVRQGIWSAADFFTLPVDNVQETFGLAPVEAMAAGLPAVVTDWDGFRDTVGHGEHGFRIPTTMGGSGTDLALRYASEAESYGAYLLGTTLGVAMDVRAAAEAYGALIASPELRQRMGAAAKAHARAQFDWSAVIPRYLALYDHLDRVRTAGGERAAPVAGRERVPLRPDPMRAFAGYATAGLAPDTRLALAPGAGPAALATVAKVPGTVARGSLLPSSPVLEAVLGRLAQGPAGAAELLALPGAVPAPRMLRGLLWLMKYDLVRRLP